MMLHVIDATYQGEFKVAIKFNDGLSALIDLSDKLDGPIFLPLKELAMFKEFTIQGHTLAWKNGADFAPEYLHELAVNADSNSSAVQL